MTFFELMAIPFAECLVLVGIHSYLGIHVLKRKVIFVDLAFAQIAALGTTVGFLFGLDPTGPGAYLFSLLFAVAAAAVFAITRLKDERIPQEAIIGLTYALAAAIAILVIDRAPHGAEHIKEIMAGSILWVRGSDVALAAGVYALVGLYHYIFRKRFLLISDDADEARRAGIRVRLWDFLFYLSFGVIISLSVRTAGVLLVFVFLVVPAMMGMMLTRNVKAQLAIGWTAGTVVSMLGLIASHRFDLPAGPAVVALYGVVLVLTAVSVYLVRAAVANLRLLAQAPPGSQAESAPSPFLSAVTRVLAGIAVIALGATGLYALGSTMTRSQFWSQGAHAVNHHRHVHDAAEQEEDAAGAFLMEEEREALKRVEDSATRALLEELMRMDIVAKENTLGKIEDVALLSGVFNVATDDEISFSVARRLSELTRPRQGPRKATCPKCQSHRALVQVLEKNTTPLFRSDAYDLLVEIAGRDFSYDPFDEPGTEENKKALEQIREWFDESEGHKSGKKRRKHRRGWHSD